MSSRAPVELDFLGVGTSSAAAGEQPRSAIRGMETSAIARIDTELLRRVIGPMTLTPAAAPAAEATTAPFTVFYNGSVAVFDVSLDKAEAIVRMATEVSAAEGRSRSTAIVGNFAKDDLPLARTKSLQRFLAKRRERLTNVGPYQRGATTKKAFDHVKETA